MSLKTKLRRDMKRAKQAKLDREHGYGYVSPVKPKPREWEWMAYNTVGNRYKES